MAEIDIFCNPNTEAKKKIPFINKNRLFSSEHISFCVKNINIMRDIVNENLTMLGGRRNNQNYHRQVLIEYQRMNQVATEYERKHVYRIECHDCNFVLTDRGMNVSFCNSYL